VTISITWGGSNNDFTSAPNWNGGALVNDTTTSIASFTSDPAVAPLLASNFSVAGVLFGGTASNVTLGGNATLTVGTSGIDNLTTSGTMAVSVPLVFSDATAVVRNAGALTLSGNVTNSTSSGLTLDGTGSLGTISGVIGGAGNLLKTGSGTWTLSRSNTFTGTTEIAAGTLKIATDSNLGAVPGSFAGSALTLSGGTLRTTATMTLSSNRGIFLNGNGGTLETDPGTTLTYGGVVSGTGNLIKAGTGTLVLTSSNQHSGTTTVQAGTLANGAAHAFSSVSDMAVAAGAALSVTADDAIAGLKDVGSAGGTVTIAAPATLTLGGVGSFSGTIGGTGKLSVGDSNASANQVLTGLNNYSGGTYIAPGSSLQLGAGGVTGAISTTGVVNDGTIVFNRSDAIGYSGLVGNGSIQQIGTGTLTLSGTSTYSGGTFIGSGTVTDGAAGALPAGGSVFLGNGTLAITANESVGGLDDWNTSSGSPAKVTVGANATLTLTQVGSYSGSVSGAGRLTIDQNAYQVLTGNATHTGGTTIANGGSLQIGNNGTSGSLSGPISNEGQLSYALDSSTSAGGISGHGTLRQVGNGTLTLTGANSYTGFTDIITGTIDDSAAGAFSPGSPVLLDGPKTNLVVNYNETIAGLGGFFNSVGSSVTLGNASVLTVAGSGRTYLGTIAGAGTLKLTGGSQTLGGGSTYSGGTVIAAGTLIATNTSGSATGTGPITIGSGASLVLGNGAGGSVSGSIANSGSVVYASISNSTYAGTISGPGGLSVGRFNTATGSLELTGSNTYTGPTFINSGTLQIGAVNALPSGSVVSLNGTGTLSVANSQSIQRFGAMNGGASIQLGAGATLTVAPAANSYGGRVNSTLSGAGALTMAGGSNSALTLTAANSYTGGTSISGGTLYLTPGATLGTGTVNVGSGATLGVELAPAGQVSVTNAVSLDSGANLQSGGKDALLSLGGPVTVAGGASTVHLAGPVVFGGGLGSASTTQLTFDSTSGFGQAIVTAPIAASISSIATNGAGVIFGSAAAVPSSSTFKITGNTGYVGLAAVAGSLPTVSSVLNLIDPTGFNGVLGFDTAGSGAPMTFTDAITLTPFGSSLSLGSTTSAVLSGAITPSSAGYLFGNGGGALVVTSALSGNYDLTVNSLSSVAKNGLIVALRGANTFTGNVSVTNSALIADSAGALPAGRTVALGADGYFGATEAFMSGAGIGSFFGQSVGSYTATSVLGLDSNANVSDHIASGTSTATRTISAPIDLRPFGPVYFGTATSLTVTGPIYAPRQNNANGVLSLIGVHGGELTIQSPLVNGNVSSLVVGSSSTSFGDGRVTLLGSSTYTGGTTLKSGTLVVDGTSSATPGASGPVGTGTLTVPSNAIHPTLAATTSGAHLFNSISLDAILQLGTVTTAISNGIQTAVVPARSGMLVLDGGISGSGGLAIFAPTVLDGANTFTGGVSLYDTTLYLGTSGALGTGTLTLNAGVAGGSTGLFHNGPLTLGNNIDIKAAPSTTISIGGAGALQLNGAATLYSDAQFAGSTFPITFGGPIGGPGRFSSSGFGKLVLSGSNTYGGGTEAQTGSIVFSSPSAIPAAPAVNAFTTGAFGYIGIGFVPANLQSDFIDRFNKGTSSGTIGLDSASAGSPNVFGGTIDLSGFSSSVRLGSSSSAVISGTIISNAGNYRFGNGGGTLQVSSPLSDTTARGIQGVDVFSSPFAPLTLQLTGANTYSGGTSATSSAVVFGPGALPAAGNLLAAFGGYIGTSDTQFATAPTSFVNRFDFSQSAGVIGFDGMTVTGDVSLAHFTGSGIGIYLGTTSSATLAGNITLPSGQSDYRFAGYKGGHLTVASVLQDGTSPRAVVIGDAAISATSSNPTDPATPLSRVTLTGANTHTGGTTLERGVLEVGNDAALGTGTLTIGSNGTLDGRHVGLFATGGARVLSNAISLGALDVDFGGTDNLTLTGALSGNGELYKVGSGRLTLSGNNSGLSGGIYLQGGDVTFTSGASVGAGPLEFGITTTGASATFLDSSAIHGISADAANDTIVLTAGKTLTVDQTFDAEFKGSFTGATAGLTYAGNSSLRLSGASSYSGPTILQSGTVVASNANAFGPSTNTVTVNGGRLAVDSSVTLANPIVFSGGTLGGAGTFRAPAGTAGFTIGAGRALSPGLLSTGALQFDGTLLNTSVLILAGGGTYNWKIADATSGAWDTVVVNGGVTFTSTASSPFNLKLISVGADGSNLLAGSFDATQSYSWTVLSANSITGFTSPSQIAIDTSAFLNPNLGSFSVSLGGGGTNLTLNFSPVPEPSTYALMGAGVGVVVLALRRRNRGKRVVDARRS
jgi:autotransporter-associated beta strand protein